MQSVRPSLPRLAGAAAALGAFALLGVLLTPAPSAAPPAPPVAAAFPALVEPSIVESSIDRPAAPALAAQARAEAVLLAPPPPRPIRPVPVPKPRPRLELASVSSRSVDALRPRPRPEIPSAALDSTERARLAPLLAEAEALVETPPTSLIGAGPLACLAVSIYHEARDQPLLGQEAVAAVILRRVEVSRWGDTICAVVRPVQFSYLDADYGFPPIREREAWRRALTVAVRALSEGPTPLVSGADHYHATYVSPAWREKMREVVRIGGHVFYSDPRSAARTGASARDPFRMAEGPSPRSDR